MALGFLLSRLWTPPAHVMPAILRTTRPACCGHESRFEAHIVHFAKRADTRQWVTSRQVAWKTTAGGNVCLWPTDARRDSLNWALGDCHRGVVPNPRAPDPGFGPGVVPIGPHPGPGIPICPPSPDHYNLHIRTIASITPQGTTKPSAPLGIVSEREKRVSSSDHHQILHPPVSREWKATSFEKGSPPALTHAHRYEWRRRSAGPGNPYPKLTRSDAVTK